MAHSSSAKKRIRQNAKKRLQNRSSKSALRTSLKKVQTAVKSGDSDAAAEAFKALQKKADTTARKGTVNKRTVARIKSRLSAKISKMSAE